MVYLNRKMNRDKASNIANTIRPTSTANKN